MKNFSNWKWKLKHTKYIFLESDDHADYKNIFCIEIGAKLKNIAEYANFANFGPPF